SLEASGPENNRTHTEGFTSPKKCTVSSTITSNILLKIHFAESPILKTVTVLDEETCGMDEIYTIDLLNFYATVDSQRTCFKSRTLELEANIVTSSSRTLLDKK
ncbi:hypothetical protein L9F63_000603, partial [Diploptera punctata]